MNIRPSYEKPEQFTREDMKTMSASEIADAVKGGHFRDILRPSFKSCCEEAQLTANELARRNEELSEAQDKIAALKRMTARMADERNRNVEAKFEALAERDEARGSRDYWIDLYGELRDELQSKLNAAEGWPDGQSGSSDTEPISDWPDWLGPLPEKSEAKREPDGYWKTGDWLINKSADPEYCREAIRHHIEGAAAHSAVLDAIESEQAKRDDETSLADSATGALVPCNAAVNISGEHFRCKLASGHVGMAHQNSEAKAIWRDHESEGE